MPRCWESWPRKVVAKEEVSVFGASGSSMLPFVRDGASLTVMAVDSELLRLSETSSWTAPATGCSLIELSQRTVPELARVSVFGGDAFSGRPEEVLPGQVLGLVVKVSHGRRSIDPRSTFWRTLGLAWIAATPVSQALLGVAVWLWSVVRRLQRALRPDSHNK